MSLLSASRRPAIPRISQCKKALPPPSPQTADRRPQTGRNSKAWQSMDACRHPLAGCVFGGSEICQGVTATLLQADSTPSRDNRSQYVDPQHHSCSSSIPITSLASGCLAVPVQRRTA
ncbi:hypothetical protein GTR04_0232 [Trichophyton interdigitale]|nr:hypothetical protein GTR04_0232 [Trichophyton interdigitale]